MFVMGDNGWKEKSIFNLERQIITVGGIKERMHAARTGYRQEIDRRLSELVEENRRLRAENEELRRIISSLTSSTSKNS